MAITRHPQLPESPNARQVPARRTGADTRQEILDAALELFIEQGYDKTSLRDIAARLGYTKAALYYHFQRKEDIFIELHLRLHELLRDAFEQLDSLPDDQARADAWSGILDQFINRVLESPQLFLLHIRNFSAFEAIQHDERNRTENKAFMHHVQRLFASSEIPLDQRIRITCSLGAVASALLAPGDAFAEIPITELAEHVRTAVHDLLGDQPTAKVGCIRAPGRA